MFQIIHEFDLFGYLAEPWALHSYGVLIALGFVFAMKLGQRQALNEGEDPEIPIDLAFYVLLTGLIGSRVVFIFTKLDEYLANPIEVLMFWRGGLVWYGGFIGAGLYVYYYSRKHRLNFFKHADMYIPLVAMAHGFGRLGCLAAGCCFGEPTDLAWGIVYPDHSMAHAAHQRAGLVAFGDSALPVHPTALYEAGFEFAIFWFFNLMRPYKRFHGQILLIWVATYPILRVVVEFVRGDVERGVYYGLSTSQWISLAVTGFAVWLYFYLRRNRVHAIEPAPA